MKRYIFNIQISCEADNANDAYREAVSDLALDPGPTPEEFETEDIEDES